jgi:hypothetical protein
MDAMAGSDEPGMEYHHITSFFLCKQSLVEDIIDGMRYNY